MTALAGFWRGETPAPPPADVAPAPPPADVGPAPVRVAHAITALGIIGIGVERRQSGIRHLLVLRDGG